MKMLLVDVPLFFAATVSISAFYFCAQKQLHADWLKRLLYIPLLLAVGIGLSVNNARAVLEAIFNQQSEFVRTPKYGACLRSEMGRTSGYATLRSLVPYIEFIFCVYFSLLQIEAVETGQWMLVPFIVMFQTGFFYVSILSFWQMFGRRIRGNRPELLPAGAIG